MNNIDKALGIMADQGPVLTLVVAILVFLYFTLKLWLSNRPKKDRNDEGGNGVTKLATKIDQVEKKVDDVSLKLDARIDLDDEREKQREDFRKEIKNDNTELKRNMENRDVILHKRIDDIFKMLAGKTQ